MIAFRTAGELRSDQVSFFGFTVQNRAGHGRANDGCVKLRFCVCELSLSLQQVALGPGDLFLSWANLGKPERLLQRMDFLLVGLILRRGVIECLFGEDTLSCQVASTIERNFVVRRGSAGLSQIVLGLLDFLGTGAIL